ncbi:ATP-binding protein [Aliihoeflea sp. 2WW]|uniref:ATP-binding protein n=1 Tax=Aliihoeflea sp. 2WW TaxID=1381123 RepID=UPI0004662E1B|nr:ATP-binding protein [Aliihoeflea sp. 2WW]
MTAATYSFIDIAVLGGVRDRFARGDALVLLSPDLERVLWANGPGAAFFGIGDIESAMDSPARLSVQAMRQIASLSGYPRIGAERTVSLRLVQGMASRMTTFQAAQIRLPRGELAILLAIPASLRGEARMKAAISGIEDAGYAAALVDAEGAVAAATSGFERLGLGRTALWTLVQDVSREHDRLVKKLVTVEGGTLPVGFARLTDEPALHLLLTSNEVDADEEDEPAAAPPEAELPAVSAQVAAEAEPEEIVMAKVASAVDEADAPPAPAPVPRAPDEPRVLPTQPIRFVWRTDASGRFAQVSSEFIDAVGGNAADVIGRSFRDVATVFGFDLNDEIAALLDRRDTWSGRTVLWPVEGHALKVPVDLAALPVYDRERMFEGFRGFGVARMADAVADPDELGLALMSPKQPQPIDPDDPFQGETPVLAGLPDFGRRASDKVVRLDDVRPGTNGKTLSPGDRQTFQEIGTKLKKEIGDEEIEAPVDSEAERHAQERARFAEAEMSETEIDAADNVVRLTDAKPADEPPAEAKDERPAPASIHFLPSAFAPRASGDESVEDRLIDHLPVATLIHSGEVLHLANHAFFDLTGFSSLDAFTRAGGLDALFEDCDDGEDGILSLKRADGAELPVRAHLHSIPWHGAKALMLTLLPQPQVEPVQVPMPTGDEFDDGEELRARLSEFQTIIDTATDGVILIDNDFAVRSISKPAEALFGFDSGAIEGRPFRELFAIESQRTAQDYVERIARKGVASVMNDGREVIGREAEGGFIPLFMTIGRLPKDGGYCAVLRDITHWKRAEEELTQARAEAERTSSQKSEFLARISHEIRTPLNAIIGFSELIINESFGPIGTERYRDYLRDISRSGNHVLDLVNDLLDISKIEAGEQEMNYEAVSLNEVLGEAVAMMQPQANRERVIIRSSFASRLPDVVADLRSIKQIALNLLSNAVRYTPAGGQVILSTALEPDGGIAIRVRDTGIGMNASEIDQALKPFKRVNALKRSHREGTGLGLPLTKAMVEANRARFAISSKPGEGTLVEIDFPPTRVLAD